MLPWIIIAVIALIDAIICINHFWLNQGSRLSSWVIWQIIILGVIAITIAFWKRISEIKPE